MKIKTAIIVDNFFDEMAKNALEKLKKIRYNINFKLQKYKE